MRAATGEILLVCPSEVAHIQDTLREAAPQVRVRHVRSIDGRAPTPSPLLIVLYEAAADPLRRPLSALHFASTMILTERPSAEAAVAAIEEGVDGYLPASISARALRAAVSGVLRGEIAYSREVIGAWLRSLRVETRAPSRPDLTPRQSQIVELIATGATDKEIAATIGIRTATAQKHVARLLKRLGVRNRAAAVAVRRRRPLRNQAAG